MGCSQVVRQRFLVPPCAGSNPATPAMNEVIMKMMVLCATIAFCGFIHDAQAQKACESKVSAVIKFKKDGKKREISRDSVLEALSASERLSQQPWEVAYPIAVKQQILDAILQRFTDEKKCSLDGDKDYKKGLERVQRDFLRTFLLQKMASANVTDKAVQKEYSDLKQKFEKNNQKAYHLSLIVVDSANKANTVKQLLKKGNNFERVAAEHNTEASMRKTEGVMREPIPDGQMPPQMLKVVKGLVDGGVSVEPVQMDSTYIFIKKRRSEKATMRPLDERTRKEITQALEARAFTKILHDLVKQTEIQAFDAQGKAISDFSLEADLSAAVKASNGEAK